MVVIGQGLKIVRAPGLDGGSSPAVQPPALQGAGTLDQRGRDQGMDEGKSPSPLPPHLPNQLGTLGVFQGINQGVFVLIAGTRQRVEIKLAPQHCGQTQGLLGIGRQYPHPRLDGHLHTSGNS